MILDPIATSNPKANCPTNYHPLFNSLRTPKVRHYCDCSGTQTPLDINYLTISQDEELSPADYCSSDSCTIKGGSLARQQVLLNILYNERICVKLISLEELFSRSLKDYAIVSSQSRCPETFYQCGYLNPSSYLCASQSNLCPVSSLKILPKDTQFKTKYYSIDLENDMSLFYSFDEKSNFLVTTDMRLGFKSVCLNSLEMRVDGAKDKLWQHWDQTFTDECSSNFWTQESPSGGDSVQKFEDPRFKEIGKINWNLLYTQNKVSDFLDSQGHGQVDFQDSQDSEMSIFFRYALRFNR